MLKKLSAPDTYIMDNIGTKKEGNISLQIREIEPEESFIKSLTLSRLRIPAGMSMLPNASHSGAYVFKETEIINRRGLECITAKIIGRESDIVSTDPSTSTSVEEQMLDENEAVEVTGQVHHTSGSPILLIKSRYRDWVAGEIKELTNEVSRQSVKSPIDITKIGVMTAALVLVWIGQLFSRDADPKEDVSVLAQSFGFRTAHADAPGGGGGGNSSGKSLLVSYLDSRGEYQQIATIHPRHAKAQLEAIVLPEAAIQDDGMFSIRIIATKRHAVSLVTLFVAETIQTDNDMESEHLPLIRATHSRLGDITRSMTPKTDDFTHTVPGDVIDLTFTSGTDTDDNIMYLLTSDGLYTGLSQEGKRLAGDAWVNKLDPQARAWLEEMYALGEYRRASRKPVLS